MVVISDTLKSHLCLWRLAITSRRVYATQSSQLSLMTSNTATTTGIHVVKLIVSLPYLVVSGQRLGQVDFVRFG